ncbi:MAG: hypothetical protein HY719_02520 [Planctomycetes bacterium]|nr:hypothetical protein [Planctomycetota bacterium]
MRHRHDQHVFTINQPGTRCDVCVQVGEVAKTVEAPAFRPGFLTRASR